MMSDWQKNTADAHLRHGNLSTALELSAFEAEKASALHDLDTLWQLRCIQAECLRLFGRLQDARSLLETAPHESLSPQIQALLAAYQGCLLAILGSYGQSRALLDQADKIAGKNNFAHTLTEIAVRRGMFFYFCHDYDASEEAYRCALASATHLSDDYLRSVAMAGVAKNHMIRGDHQIAIAGFNDALEIATARDYRLVVAGLWGELGWGYYNLKNDERSLEFYQKAEKVNKQAGAIPNYQICLANIGNIYLRRGDGPSAISYYQRALDLACKIKDPISTAKWLRNLSRAFSAMDNPVQAASYAQQAHKVQSELDLERARVAANT